MIGNFTPEFENLLEDYKNIIKNFDYNDKNTIPLCAAESTLSDFAKSPLTSTLQERYIRGSARKFEQNKNFSGSEYIFPLYEKIHEVSNLLFDCKYADARPLSGMNATISVLMSATKYGDNVLLYPSDAGGHESFPPICDRLGLNHMELPYDYNNYQIDIEKTNKLIKQKNISAIILAPSDIIFPPELDKIEKPGNCVIIYDATQTLGLIAGKKIPNPFRQIERLIITGGTHKTLPGPTSGLILIDDEELITQLDTMVSPIYVRNPQPHQIACLLLSLIEFHEVGEEYMGEIQKNSNFLGKRLEIEGFKLAKRNSKFSDTHQLFLKVSQNESLSLEKNARNYRMTLDGKSKKVYGEAGIRIGVQTVTRFGWQEKDFDILANLLWELKNDEVDWKKAEILKRQLPQKNQLKYCIK